MSPSCSIPDWRRSFLEMGVSSEINGASRAFPQKTACCSYRAEDLLIIKQRGTCAMMDGRIPTCSGKFTAE
jgi:hypothetical protein